jgi:deoxyribose-phosphate aldolase
MVPFAREVLGDSGVRIAAVATAFPSGRASMPVKLADTRDAVAAGADEIDMVIDRGAFLAGDYRQVFDEIVAVKAACRRLTARAPDSRSSWRPANWSPTTTSAAPRGCRCSPAATSSRRAPARSQPAATLPVTLIMLEAVRDWREVTGQQIGVKPAGGIRTSKDAIKFLVAVNEVAGPDWLDNHWFRFGASSSAQRPLLQRQRLRIGAYSGADYIPTTPPSATDPEDLTCRPSTTHRPPSPGPSSTCNPPTACSSTETFVDGSGTAFKTDQPGHRGVPRRGRRGDRRRRRPCRQGRAGGIPGRVGADVGADRGKYLFRIARIMQERARELAVLETLDNGKPIKESRDVDVPLAAAHFFYHAGWADKLGVCRVLGPDPRPLGVVGQVIPWNFPLLMLAWKIAPALACGNTVVLKPAETTP